MGFSGALQLAVATAIFLAAASSAKAWALQPGALKLVLTLALYTLGNLIIMRLIREMGMAVALSISAVVQLIAVNFIAFAIFGERVDAMQGAGIALAVAAVALIALGPLFAAGR